MPSWPRPSATRRPPRSSRARGDRAWPAVHRRADQAYQQEFGWHAVWSHEFIFPTVYEQMEPVIELVRGYIETDYDYPSTMGALKADIEAASSEILDGLTGRRSTRCAPPTRSTCGWRR